MGSQLTTKPDTWHAPPPRTLAELSAIVDHGGSIFRDAQNADTVTVQWAEHAAWHRKLVACSMSSTTKQRMAIKQLGLAACQFRLLPLGLLGPELMHCDSVPALLSHLLRGSLQPSNPTCEELFDALCSVRKCQGTLFQLKNSKWGSMHVAQVVQELAGATLQGILGATTPEAPNSGDPSRLIAVCNADPECPFTVQHTYRLREGLWHFVAERSCEHTCSYDSAFIRTVKETQSKLATLGRAQVNLTKVDKLPRNQGRHARSLMLAGQVQDLEAETANHGISDSMLRLRHRPPYNAMQLAPCLKQFFHVPGCPPPSEAVVRSHIKQFTHYPVSDDFVQGVRACAMRYFEPAGKGDIALLPKFIAALRLCGHKAHLETVDHEDAWDLMVQARQAQVRHATPEGKQVKTITREDVQQPAPGLYVVGVSWAPSQVEAYSMLAGTTDPWRCGAISHDGAHMRHRMNPGTLMSSVRLDANRNIHLVSMAIFVRPECTHIWESHYRNVLAVAPEASGRARVDVATGQISLAHDDSVSPASFRATVLSVHDHDKGCNNADASVLHRYPAGAPAVRCFMDPVHLGRNVAKIKKRQAKAVICCAMNTDSGRAQTQYKALDPLVQEYLFKTSGGDSSRFMVSHQLQQGPMDGTYTSNASEVFQRMSEPVRAASSILESLRLAVLSEKKRREDAVLRVASSSSQARFPPRMDRVLRERKVAFDKHYTSPYDKYVTLTSPGCTSEGEVLSTKGKRHHVRVWRNHYSGTAAVQHWQFYSATCTCGREPHPCFHVMVFCFVTGVCDWLLLVPYRFTKLAWARQHPSGYQFEIPRTDWAETTDDSVILDEIRQAHALAPDAPVVLCALTTMRVGRGRPRDMSLRESNHILYGASDGDASAVRSLNLLLDMPQDWYEPGMGECDAECISTEQLSAMAMGCGWDLKHGDGELELPDIIEHDIALPVDMPVLSLKCTPKCRAYFDQATRLLTTSGAEALRREAMARLTGRCQQLLDHAWPGLHMSDVRYVPQLRSKQRLLDGMVSELCTLEQDCHIELCAFDSETCPFTSRGTLSFGQILGDWVKRTWGEALVERYIMAMYHPCLHHASTQHERVLVEAIVQRAAVACADCTLAMCPAMVVPHDEDDGALPVRSHMALEALSQCAQELAVVLKVAQGSSHPRRDIRADALLSTGTSLPWAQLQHGKKGLPTLRCIRPSGDTILDNVFLVRGMLTAAQEQEVEYVVGLIAASDSGEGQDANEWAMYRHFCARGEASVPLHAAERVLTGMLCDQTMEVYSNMLCHLSMLKPRLPRCFTSRNTGFYLKITSGDDGAYRYSDVYTNHIRLSDADLILFPVHLTRCLHWVLVALDLQHRECRYYDSLASSLLPKRDCTSITTNCLYWLRDKAHEEMSAQQSAHVDQVGDINTWSKFHNGYKWELTNYKAKSVHGHLPATHTPQQENLVDCGVCALKFMQCEVLGLSVDGAFGTGVAEMQTFRRRMVLEVLEGRIHATLADAQG